LIILILKEWAVGSMSYGGRVQPVRRVFLFLFVGASGLIAFFD